MEPTYLKYGIEGHPAIELNVPTWIDENGIDAGPYKLKDLAGKFIVLYCFQSWCPGCHRTGFPSLQQMVSATKENDKVAFMAIQTVFRGQERKHIQKSEGNSKKVFS